MDINQILTNLLIAVITFAVVMINVVVIIYFERKILGDMQYRLSVMRVGTHGVLQPIADALKLMIKEDIIPRKADRLLFVLAPFLFFVPMIMLFMMIPVSDKLSIPFLNITISGVAKNLELGLLFFFAILTVIPIGLIIAGWASNSKYSLIGGLRSAAQQISYEIPLLMATIGVIMIAGSMNLTNIVQSQSGVITLLGFKTFIPNWFIFYQPVGFLLFFTSVLADLNRPPFDLPEAESEIIAGPFTEYSSMKYALFILAEFAAVFVMAAMITVLYLGGWHGPLLPPLLWFFLKTYFVLFIGIWIKATFPRLRIDQLMNFGWKVLLPVALLNITITGLLIIQAGTK